MGAGTAFCSLLAHRCQGESRPLPRCEGEGLTAPRRGAGLAGGAAAARGIHVERQARGARRAPRTDAVRCDCGQTRHEFGARREAGPSVAAGTGLAVPASQQVDWTGGWLWRPRREWSGARSGEQEEASMSATESTVPAALAMGAGGTASAGLPPERRTLVALLTVLEGLLLVAASVLVYFYQTQSGPVPLAGGGSGSGSYFCVQPAGPGTDVPSPCPPVYGDAQLALLAAVVCSAVGLLVLPAVIGAVSRRWQSALAAPSLPVWVVLLVLMGVELATNAGALLSAGGGIAIGGMFAWSPVLSMAGPLLTALFLVAALGGLGWLTRRAFGR